MSTEVEPHVYRRPPDMWTGPQHARRGPHGDEAHLSVHFFWTTWGEPYRVRTPPGSFPADDHYLPRHSVDVVMPPPEPDTTLVAFSYVGEPPPLFPHEGPAYDKAVSEGRAVRCTVCRWVSFHKDDIAHGWCGHCRAFTAQVFWPDESGYVLGGTSREHLQDAGYDYIREEADHG